MRMLLHAATSLCPAREWNALKAQTGKSTIEKKWARAHNKSHPWFGKLLPNPFDHALKTRGCRESACSRTRNHTWDHAPLKHTHKISLGSLAQEAIIFARTALLLQDFCLHSYDFQATLMNKCKPWICDGIGCMGCSGAERKFRRGSKWAPILRQWFGSPLSLQQTWK